MPKVCAGLETKLTLTRERRRELRAPRETQHLSKRVRDGLAPPRSHLLASMGSLAMCGPGGCETSPQKRGTGRLRQICNGLARAAVRSFGQDEPAQRQEFEAVGQVSGRARLLPRQCTSRWVNSDENSNK